MIRKAPNGWTMRLIVLWLAGLFAASAPIAEADDYAFLFPEDQAAVGGAEALSMKPGASPAMAEEESDSRDDCACPLCMMATGEWLMPSILPPQEGEAMSPASVGFISSSYRSEIFRPPIV